jgi:hypothetical protein
MIKALKKIYDEHEHFDLVTEALDRQKERDYTMLNYICNKNSYPLPRGFDHEKFLDDVQDFENYLLEV